MRRTDSALVALAVALLAAGIGAHGVHDLRGRVRLEPGRLQLRFDRAPDHASARGGRCLDLLDQLHVRDHRGRRLVGTVDAAVDDGWCRLDYRLDGDPGGLSLQLRPSRAGAARGERLVLQPWRGDAPHGDVLLLDPAGNVEILALDP